MRCAPGELRRVPLAVDLIHPRASSWGSWVTIFFIPRDETLWVGVSSLIYSPVASRCLNR